MPYSQFNTITKVKEAFNLTSVEGIRFLPDIEPIQPSPVLKSLLETNIPWAIATSTEKARSEAIINSVLLEVRRIFNQEISVFLLVYQIPVKSNTNPGKTFSPDKVLGFS
ncbi:MAG: hypothetical protein WAN66_04800 [Limnoraphis robusta]|uniref:Uncharacterized protein n=1 Tax=Limnoraphis robusta CS-951 TaxID=1637645 RepID=A0A0J9EXN2_9CYAN|nr:hypothetical protein [Limnoraphis robusta]KMW70737.1 hypothetical protein WN50_32960 [Limnoraphis robusta CS-951]